jgi:hypothetical protein
MRALTPFLSRILASEYGKHDFRIDVLVPGGIWTSGTKNLAKEAMKFKLNVFKSGTRECFIHEKAFQILAY